MAAMETSKAIVDSRAQANIGATGSQGLAPNPFDDVPLHPYASMGPQLTNVPVPETPFPLVLVSALVLLVWMLAVAVRSKPRGTGKHSRVRRAFTFPVVLMLAISSVTAGLWAYASWNEAQYSKPIVIVQAGETMQIQGYSNRTFDATLPGRGWVSGSFLASQAGTLYVLNSSQFAAYGHGYAPQQFLATFSANGLQGEREAVSLSIPRTGHYYFVLVNPQTQVTAIVFDGGISGFNPQVP